MKVRQQQTGHRNIKEDYLLRGKIICEKCGGTFVGSRRKRGDGTYWAYYDCNKKMRQKLPCSHSRELSKTYIEDFVLNKLAELVFDDKQVPVLTNEYNAYLKAHNGGTPNTVELQNQLKKLTKKIENLVDTLSEAKSSALIDKLNQYEDERFDLEQRIRDLERIKPKGSVTLQEMKEVFKIIRQKLTSGTLSAKKQLIDVFVNRIMVYEEAVVVQFNFFPQVPLPPLSAKDVQEDKPNERAFEEKSEALLISSKATTSKASSIATLLSTAIQRNSFSSGRKN